MRCALSLLKAGSVILAFLTIEGRSIVIGDEPEKPIVPIVLFDGKNLDDWKPIGGSKVGIVSLQGDVIALSVGSPMTGVTSTRANLPTLNYSLTFEAKRTSGNDFFAAATFPVGPSFVTLVNGGWGGSVTGLSLINGASASENETNHFFKYQNDVGYSLEIPVTARVLRTLIDGVEVFAFDHEDAQLKTRIETRANEPLGFASYRSSSLIRKAQVRPLTPAEVAEANARIKQD